jgi:hypothetical protein
MKTENQNIKQRNKTKIIIAAATVAALIGIGTGVGIGYASFFNSNSKPSNPSNIKIYGSESLQGTKGVPGRANFKATDDQGKDLLAPS